LTITVEIKPEVEAELARQAAAHGRAFESHVASLLEEAVHLPEHGTSNDESQGQEGSLRDFSRHASALDWSQCAAVESIPGKVGGAWVFKNTRMPVAAVFENLEDGVTIDELTELYAGLTREQITAVLDFAARSLDATARAD